MNPKIVIRSETDADVSAITEGRSGYGRVKVALLDHLADFLIFRTPDVMEILYQGKLLGDSSDPAIDMKTGI